MPDIFYFLLPPLLASFKATLQGYLTKTKSKELPAMLRLNGLIFLAVFVVLFPIFYRGLPSARVILPALLYALSSVAFQTCYVLAFREGPVGLTTVMSCFNLVFPMLLGFFFYGERISLFNAGGLALLAVPLILLPKRDGRAATRKWFLFALLATVTSGIANSVVMVMARSSMNAYDLKLYIVLGYLIASLLSLGLSRLLRRGETPEPLTPRFCLSVLPVGAALGFHTLVMTAALQHVSSVVLYPVINIALILITVCADYLIYRERLTKRQLVGVFFGAVCIVLLNL